MSGVRQIFIGLMLSGLFAFALIMSGSYLAIQNNANQSILDDSSLSSFKDALESNLSQSTTDTNSSLESLGNSPISGVLGSTIFDSISGVWKTLKSVPIAIYNLITQNAKERIFGDSYLVVFIVIGAIVTIIIIFGIIKLVTQGQDE